MSSLTTKDFVFKQYQKGVKMAQIARNLGISRQRVSQIVNATLDKTV